jgi:hypothetical protein
MVAAATARHGKTSLILMHRDLEALQQLYLHRAMSSKQFAALCFHNCGYETARKRVRKLIKHGYLGVTNRRHSQGRGRPEQLYFVTEAGAEAIRESISTGDEPGSSGVPHPYLKDHCLAVAEVHLALRRAEKEGLIKELEWTAGRQLRSEYSGSQSDKPDAVISFENGTGKTITAAIIVDTGNLRQTRHWEPKLHFLLKMVPAIWIITGNTTRILTLRRWTQPVLESYDAKPDHCIFGVYDDLINDGVFNARWVDVHGNSVDLL